MGVPSRMENILKLKSILDLSDDDIFLDIEYRKNPMWSWKQTIKDLDPNISHIVIVQDDAILPNHFKKFCEYLVNRFPNAIWALYNHKDLTKILRKYVIFRPGCCMGGVVNIIPTKYINDIIESHEKDHPMFIHDDKYIHYYASHHNIDVLSTFPSAIGTKDYQSSLDHAYDIEYPRCYDPMNHKWANSTTFKYSNHDWSKLDTIWNIPSAQQ